MGLGWLTAIPSQGVRVYPGTLRAGLIGACRAPTSFGVCIRAPFYPEASMKLILQLASVGLTVNCTLRVMRK